MELKDTIVQMSAQLKSIDEVLLRAVELADSVVPKKCYKVWRLRSQYHKYLADVGGLVDLREKALKEMIELDQDASASTSGIDERQFRYYDTLMKFSEVRFFLLVNYMSITWSIYDKLANVCARIVGPLSIGNSSDVTRNAKLYGSFLVNKNDKSRDDHEQIIGQNSAHEKSHVDRPDGFALDVVLSSQWLWPVAVSYKIRNLITHEGMCRVEGDFFVDNSPKNGFKICEDLKRSLERTCTKQVNGAEVSREYLSKLATEEGFPWYGDDLLIILQKYNAEIDDLYSKLLLWCVPSFCSQVTLFSEPDKQLLTPWMVNNG